MKKLVPNGKLRATEERCLKTIQVIAKGLNGESIHCSEDKQKFGALHDLNDIGLLTINTLTYTIRLHGLHGMRKKTKAVAMIKFQ